MIRFVFEFSLPFDEDDTFLILQQDDVQDYLGKCIENFLYHVSDKYADGLRLGDISSRIDNVEMRDGEVVSRYGSRPLGANREVVERHAKRLLLQYYRDED